MSDTTEDKPTHCLLAHRMFALFEHLVFRRTDADATPVMVVHLGEREAAMPLRAVQREFGIPDDSADGRMLALIGEALDFVPALRLGDKLPLEVLTGDASWQPGAEHVHRALTRLNLQLVAWLHGTAGSDTVVLDAEALAQADADPVLRQHVQEAFQRAAAFLKLPSKEAVIAQMESLASELSYIEALRDRLLDRVRALAIRIERMCRVSQSDSGQRGSLGRLRFLSAEALQQLNRRFEEQDAQGAEVMAVLRNLESHRGFIRSNRDWLYRSHMAWDPLLAEWDKAGALTTDALRPLLIRTYQFLAPRFMPVTEWLKGAKAGKKAEAGGLTMVW
jgi:hypothetical protein